MARNKYPEVTVEKILDVSQRLFLEKGYDNTTIQDIVDHLDGLTKGAVYHHFKSKEEIMDAVGDRMFATNNPFEKVRGRSDLNGLQKLREAIRLNQSDADRTEKSQAFGGDDRVQPAHPDAVLSGAAGGRKQGRIHPYRVYQGNRGIDAPAHQPLAAAFRFPCG